MIVLEVPRPWLLTLNQRLNHYDRAARTKNLRTKAQLLARGHDRFDRAAIRVDIQWPDNRRRDRHNLFPTVKAAVDGLVDAGVIPDDDDLHLDGPHLYTSAARCEKPWACVLYITITEQEPS